MHELHWTENMLETVLAHGRANRVSKITAIHLEIGELREFVDEWVQRYFEHLSKNTLAEGAQLKIEKIPVSLKCDSCNTTFQVDARSDGDVFCPKCKESQCSIVEGMEYRIKHIETL